MAIVVNKPLPEFEANATGGLKVSNTSHLGQVLVLYFYPKDNTPGCTTEAMQFRDKYKDFVKAGAVVTNAVVLVENGRVKAVGPSVAIPAGAKTIDLSGYTVLPGLIDCHTHLVGDSSDADPLTELRSTSAKRAFDSVPNARVTLEEP